MALITGQTSHNFPHALVLFLICTVICSYHTVPPLAIRMLWLDLIVVQKIRKDAQCLLRKREKTFSVC